MRTDTQLTRGSAVTCTKAHGFWSLSQDPPLGDCKSPHPAHLPLDPSLTSQGTILNPITASPCFEPPVGPCIWAKGRSQC